MSGSGASRPRSRQRVGGVLERRNAKGESKVATGNSLLHLLDGEGMWDNTLIVFSSDNGGVTDGINFPLRGEKHTNWNGAFQVASMISGGFVPDNLRGTSSSLRISIADWYPTFCALAGASADDPPPVAPLPVDPTDPSKDIWGAHSFPDVDGVNVWPLLTGELGEQDEYAAHHDLWLSAEVMISGDYKVNFKFRAKQETVLIAYCKTHRGIVRTHAPFAALLTRSRVGQIVVAQPSPLLMNAKSVNSGWKDTLGVWHQPPASSCGLAYKDRTTPFKPCLFNLKEDPREMIDISAKEPEILNRLWKQLNETVRYESRSPAKLLGKCKPKCASKKWGGAQGPICGVPGCV